VNLGLDTSVVVRLLAGVPEDLAFIALRFLRERIDAGHHVFVSDWVLAEAYYAFQYHYGASKKDTLDALRSFLATSGVESSEEIAAVLSTPRLAAAKPGFVDRVIHGNYLAAGMDEMVTFERAAAKLPAVRVLTA
jgi:predicted nucleic-acid-binding protein